tara:strand:- start:2218 stop:2937 length:720 start_codon:yes stop_codon:yes gene_type:complete
MLETGECILIRNQNRVYTDCMEFSLLRFLQLLTCDINQIKKDGKSHYIMNNDLIHNKLKKYINNFPYIHKCLKNYQNNVKERSKWSETISDTDGIDYYRNDSSELFTSVENIFNFLKVFLNLEQFIDFSKNLTLQEKFDKISANFTTANKKINIIVSDITTRKEIINMKKILSQVSRPDNNYKKYLDNNFKVVSRETIIYIYVNDHVYEWTLWEKFIENSNFRNNFITGHSVIISYKLK